MHEHCCRWWNTWDRKASLREWQISQIFNSSVTIHASFYRLRVIPLWIKIYFILLEIQILLLFEESASKSADNASGVSGSSESSAGWWWWRNVVSESVLTPRKPRLEADTAAFLRRLHRKQYLGISCYADMTVSNHCRDPGHCDHQSRSSPSWSELTSKEILHFDE